MGTGGKSLGFRRVIALASLNIDRRIIQGRKCVRGQHVMLQTITEDRPSRSRTTRPISGGISSTWCVPGSRSCRGRRCGAGFPGSGGGRPGPGPPSARPAAGRGDRDQSAGDQDAPRLTRGHLRHRLVGQRPTLPCSPAPPRALLASAGVTAWWARGPGRRKSPDRTTSCPRSRPLRGILDAGPRRRCPAAARSSKTSQRSRPKIVIGGGPSGRAKG